MWVKVDPYELESGVYLKSTLGNESGPNQLTCGEFVDSEST